MRIAQLAPLWKTVPPLKYGGSELVVANLTDALAGAGHDLTVFACSGSRVAGQLVEVLDRPLYDILGGFSWTGVPAHEFLEYDELFKRIDEFDIVHNHLGFHPLVFAQLLGRPMVTTIHSSVPPDFPYLAERFKENNFVSISNAQRQVTPYLNYVATVYHGIEIQKYAPDYGRGEYLLFIGTLSPQKGIGRAVKAAVELKERLIIAGEIRQEHKSFLEENVFPYVDGKNISYIGEVGFEEKAKLYSKAKALLFPIDWNEAFGLVMVEALACGTPVVAWRNGSVPEIIEHGKTGFIAEDFETFKNYILEVQNISREQCRKHAEQRFDASVMAQNYLEVYNKLIQGSI